MTELDWSFAVSTSNDGGSVDFIVENPFGLVLLSALMKEQQRRSELMRLSPAVCLMVVLAGLNPKIGSANAARHGADKANLVVVYKSDRRLQLRRNDDILHSYQVALGWAPKGHKRREGDGRTPEGVYTLDWRNPDSQFYRSIHISYPEERDLANATRWGTSAGGMIMIHGLPNKADPIEPENHHLVNWTDGCIAVTNAEIEEIWSDVEDGTPIIIFP